MMSACTGGCVSCGCGRSCCPSQLGCRLGVGSFIRPASHAAVGVICGSCGCRWFDCNRDASHRSCRCIRPGSHRARAIVVAPDSTCKSIVDAVCAALVGAVDCCSTILVRHFLLPRAIINSATDCCRRQSNISSNRRLDGAFSRLCGAACISLQSKHRFEIYL